MKKAQMPAFAWIFSLLVGAVLLFLAFYSVFKIGSIERPQQQIAIASSINVLLEPFYGIGSIAEARSDIIELPRNLDIEFGCNIDKDYSEIKTKEQNQERFEAPPLRAYNKYIFSKPIKTPKTRNGRVFAFSVPLKKPFFITSIIIIASEGYCFVGLPAKYKELLDSIDDAINVTGFNFTYVNSKDKCPDNYIKVCKNDRSCDINIECSDSDCNYGEIDGKYWFDNLIFAAIFSSESVYNCNLDRILNRLKVLSKIYKEKATLLGNKGCKMGDISGLLEDVENKADNLIKEKKEANLNALYTLLDNIDNQNYMIEPLDCKL